MSLRSPSAPNVTNPLAPQETIVDTKRMRKQSAGGRSIARLRLGRMLLASAAMLSLVAALVHMWFIPEHYGEWWGYGLFFFAAATLQLFYSGALLLWPGRNLFLVGIAGNALIIGLYAVTRTTGIPSVGPDAGAVEQVAVLDMLCVLAETAQVLVLAALAGRPDLFAGAFLDERRSSNGIH